MDLHYSQTVWSCFLAFFGFTTLWIYTILKRPWRSWNGYAVLLPYGFTLFSNIEPLSPFPRRFYYLMDLHYSQTSLTELKRICSFTTLWIYTILKPHCWPLAGCTGFTTLWIYTILKPKKLNDALWVVLLPYGFTLFSNGAQFLFIFALVLLPYGFTLFSNQFAYQGFAKQFYYLMDLHYSQTIKYIGSGTGAFYYLMDLHYSQTKLKKRGSAYGFTTLWIYTILKL